jgi:hypothetical protein
MRRGLRTAALALLEGAAALALLATPALAHSRKLDLFGLTADQHLIRFREDGPRRNRDLGPITNLSGDTRLLGIDFRPATGELYGLGDQGGIYTIDTRHAQATFRAQLSANGAPLLPSGASFGVDFNPTVDRLRVVSDTGQNLRINVDTGVALVDGALNVGGVAAGGVTGAGYTNNDADPATGTTLFDLDTSADQVVIQLPPNAGALTPTGSLGVDAAADAGFDIWSRVEDGRAVSVRAFAALTTDASRLYEVDVLTGLATSRGRFRSGQQVIGLAVALD